VFNPNASCSLLPAGVMMPPRLSARAIRLAVISEGANLWPLYVAEANGRFEQEGVTVETTLTGSSVQQLERLIKGDYDVGFQQSDHVVRAVENGSDLFTFMSFAHAPELSLVVASSIGSFADLKGKVIAVDGARTGYALLLRKLLASKGYGDNDYTFQEFGGSRERFDAMNGGRASASLLNPPFDRKLIAAGFKSLGTSKDFFPDYPGPIGAARRSWARQNEQQLIAFIRAFDASYAWLKDARNKAGAIRILMARLNFDANDTASAYDAYIGRPPPEITPAGIRQVIDVVWDVEGYKGAKGDPDKYLDLSYKRKALR
jgi:ABC-type nitrate/sulfonate/bicarbonate transport system substrate-binding protein